MIARFFKAGSIAVVLLGAVLVSQPSALHAQNLRSKGGGGTIALVTFLALTGLWCLIAIVRTRKSTLE